MVFFLVFSLTLCVAVRGQQSADGNQVTCPRLSVPNGEVIASRALNTNARLGCNVGYLVSTGDPLLCTLSKTTNETAKAVWVGNQTCEDENECTDRKKPCKPTERCFNNDGSFTCGCRLGYRAENGSCEDIDECAEGSDNCSPSTQCINADGSFACTCRCDAEQCQGIQQSPCALGTHNCPHASVCKPVLGLMQQYLCICDRATVSENCTDPVLESKPAPPSVSSTGTVVVSRGSVVAIWCAASKRTTDNLTWSSPLGRPVAANYSSKAVLNATININATISINTTSTASWGVYTCSASNSAGQAQSSVSILTNRTYALRTNEENADSNNFSISYIAGPLTLVCFVAVSVAVVRFLRRTESTEETTSEVPRNLPKGNLATFYLNKKAVKANKVGSPMPLVHKSRSSESSARVNDEIAEDFYDEGGPSLVSSVGTPKFMSMDVSEPATPVSQRTYMQSRTLPSLVGVSHLAASQLAPKLACGSDDIYDVDDGDSDSLTDVANPKDPHYNTGVANPKDPHYNTGVANPKDPHYNTGVALPSAPSGTGPTSPGLSGIYKVGKSVISSLAGTSRSATTNPGASSVEQGGKSGTFGGTDAGKQYSNEQAIIPCMGSDSEAEDEGGNGFNEDIYAEGDMEEPNGGNAEGYVSQNSRPAGPTIPNSDRPASHGVLCHTDTAGYLRSVGDAVAAADIYEDTEAVVAAATGNPVGVASTNAPAPTAYDDEAYAEEVYDDAEALGAVLGTTYEASIAIATEDDIYEAL